MFSFERRLKTASPGIDFLGVLFFRKTKFPNAFECFLFHAFVVNLLPRESRKENKPRNRLSFDRAHNDLRSSPVQYAAARLWLRKTFLFVFALPPSGFAFCP